MVYIESDEETLYRNMLARGRSISVESTPEAEEQQRAWIRVAWLYNQWLEREARHYGLPILSSQPHETLATRIVESDI